MSERLRWILRKGTRGAAALGSVGTGWVAARRRLATGPRVRALTYHRFGPAQRDPWVVSPADFEAQMAALAQSGRAISLADLRAFLAGERTLPDGAVLVTIDDGCLSTLEHALPALARHRVPAVAFVTAGLVGSPGNASGDHDEPFLSWSQLGELIRGGVSIGSHAFDHKSLARMRPEDAAAQARRSRELLEQKLGVPVPSFAYPFGMRADFDARTDRLLSEAGYAIAFHALHGAIAPGDSPISLPRVKVEGGEGLRMFRWSCDGAMDAWRLVDDALGRLRTRRTETPASGDAP